MDFYLKTDGRLVNGEGKFRWGKEIKLQIKGGFIDGDENYLKLEYSDTNPLVLRYGTIIFNLTPDGEALEGRFVGYAPEPRKLIYGKIDLTKQ